MKRKYGRDNSPRMALVQLRRRTQFRGNNGRRERNLTVDGSSIIGFLLMYREAYIFLIL